MWKLHTQCKELLEKVEKIKDDIDNNPFDEDDKYLKKLKKKLKKLKEAKDALSKVNPDDAFEKLVAAKQEVKTYKKSSKFAKSRQNSSKFFKK